MVKTAAEELSRRRGSIPFHFSPLALDVSEQLFCRFFQDRVYHPRGQLDQRHEDKLPLMKTGMGYNQAAMLDDFRVTKEYVQVNDPRSPSNRSDPAQFVFNPFQRLQERMRRKPANHSRHAIDEPILL